MTTQIFLSESDWKLLIDQQNKLDDNIREKLKIPEHTWDYRLQPNQDIALQVEKAELVNEVFDVWKYWKSKPVKIDRILDEAIDVIHFAVMQFNKQYRNYMIDGKPESIMAFDIYTSKKMMEEHNEQLHDDFHMFLHSFLFHKASPTETLAKVLIILEHYDFTSDDVMEAYRAKNVVNHHRLSNGY